MATYVHPVSSSYPESLPLLPPSPLVCKISSETVRGRKKNACGKENNLKPGSSEPIDSPIP
ncbi:hypothetical protein Bpfe_006275, partial [Biomphalaria pfeifferi]